MASRLPANSTEFLDVPGIGEAKLEKFGSEFLEIIENYQPNA